MSSRFPLMPLSELDPEQRRAYDEAMPMLKSRVRPERSQIPMEERRRRAHRTFLTTTTPHTEPRVPFNPLNAELSKLPGFRTSAREVVILVPAQFYESPYIKDISNGVKPNGKDSLAAAGEVAFDAATEAVGNKGSLSDETFRRAEELFGKEGTASLTHFTGIYAYICVLVNVSEVPAPTE